MSHLTAPMPTGHRISKPHNVLDFPRPAHPLTPPDTDYETLSHQALPVQNLAGLETEPLPPHQSSSVTDSPFSTLHRKRPSVTYVNSTLRESRERVIHRGLKWLVVVVPPVSFTREHGHLGHTLSSGPSRRLSNGLLMPLYPTLSSQLGAIAREFSFPSISGLCVYLHTTHGGLSLSPRVSDESWPLLWGHLFDARSPSLPTQQLPISGQIEFDIDLPKARWFDSWLASSRREYIDVPQSVTPSRAQSISHWRGDSQTSINEPLDDQTDVISVVQPAKNASRNIKKLSLLDRFDGVSVRSGSKLVPRDESPPSQTARQAQALQSLSPIVQEDEPATAKKDIDSRVQSWRMSATAAARSPLAATGQTSLDPANMPNTMEDLPTASTSEMRSELNLDDYTWSVSSAGPPDYDFDLESHLSWGRVPSVHIDRRGEGSVCLTASVCTSFGPDDDYDPFSPISYISRLPSPDLAWRMLDDAPPTPTTATSWGAPLEFPPSPLMSPYAPSIDLAARCLSSRPATPSTATSWGAPLSFPPSPVLLSRAASPDIGERGMSSVPSSPKFRRGIPPVQPYALVYPYYNAAAASSWQHVWPYVEASNADREQVEEHKESARMQGFPSPRPWKQVWPYAASSTDSQEERASTPVSIAFGYPVIDVYPAAYPSFDIYPAPVTLDDSKIGMPAVSSGGAYPIFDLYPAVYPSFNIYPAALTVATREAKEVSIRLATVYPVIELYPSVYPYITIYPAISHGSYGASVHLTTKERASVSAVLVNVHVDYPFFDIYPAARGASSSVRARSVPRSSSVVEVLLKAEYPAFDIYPSVYPYNLDTIYPSVAAAKVSELTNFAVSVGVRLQYPVFDLYPSISRSQEGGAVSGLVIKLPSAYPVFDIYPAVYPWSLEHIYPEVPQPERRSNDGVVVKLAAYYPIFDIYPAVYPYSMQSVYPALPSPPVVPVRSAAPVPARQPLSLRPSARSQHRPSHSRTSSLKRDVPPVPPLPKNVRDLTPFSPVSRRPLPMARVGIPVLLNVVYPNVCPYPPVYPHFAIYPEAMSGMSKTVDVELTGKTSVVSQYPNLVIYPSVYPYLEIYPGSWGPVISQAALGQVAARRQPKFTHMELRSQVFATAKPTVAAPAPVRRQPKHTHMELRAQVLAETPARVAIPAPARRRPTFSHLQLHEQVSAEQPETRSPALPEVVVAQPSPATPDLFSPPEPEFELVTPTVRSAVPTPAQAPLSPPEPGFEIVLAPAPTSVVVAPPTPPTPPTQARRRSGTVSTRPPGAAPSPPRPVINRPPILIVPESPPSSAADAPSPSAPSPNPPPRTLKRLSGLPAHPAANRRIPSAVPRPMSAFGPLPAVPVPTPGPSPVARRQQSMMSPLQEEKPSPISRASPQLPSPPDEWQRSYKTPTETSPTSRLAGSGTGLSRSNTMPSRAAPRGPRSSTLISERARLFNTSNGAAADEAGSKLLSTLAEFPTPPKPPMPTSPARPTVSKLDRSKYPFA
ncbi:hypothetical protein C8Q78DRAFT_1003590 [Trametes maxima]|nr:hypothetical protein C8Q78DRAFT_1003590 [Trametes maxima]